jgi:hypothetical protein
MMRTNSGRLPVPAPVVRKNNSALRISTIRALGSDVKSTLRVGRIADVTSADSRGNNVMHLLPTRWFYGERILLRSTPADGCRLTRRIRRRIYEPMYLGTHASLQELPSPGAANTELCAKYDASIIQPFRCMTTARRPDGTAIMLARRRRDSAWLPRQKRQGRNQRVQRGLPSNTDNPAIPRA